MNPITHAVLIDGTSLYAGLDLRYLKLSGSLAEVANHSHTVLTDIGTNTHAQIDTFIGTTVPNTYLKLDQTTPQTAVGTFTLPILHTPTINGGILANDDITIQGTTHATRTTSYVILQPNGGNVGIGTTGPSGKLDVSHDTDQSVYLGRAKIHSVVSDYAYFSHYDMGAYTNYALRQSATGETVLNAPAGKTVSLAIGTVAKMTMDANGNVGIGTTSPNQLFNVNGVSSFENTVYFQNGTVGLWSWSTTGFNRMVHRAASNYALSFGSNGISDRMVMDTSGNVGIGTTSPTSKLHLAAGSATAGTAPLGFTSGTLLTAAVVGKMEFLTDDYFLTITTGAARKGIILDDGARLTSGKMPIASTNGRLIDVTPQTELTDELTTITFTAPSTPDYAIADLTAIGGYGFVSKDEGNSVLSVIANLQARVNELETKLVALGLLVDAD